MAWLETKGEVYRIRFRFGGAKRLLPLNSSDRSEANDTLSRFESNLRLIERGIIERPPVDADVGVYIVSGGKLTGRPSLDIAVERVTLKKLFESYLTKFPREAKEVRTWRTETSHIKHFRRLLDMNLFLSEITTKTLQTYVDARITEAGRRKKTVRRETIHKEIGTFSTVWNKWGMQQGFADRPAPVKNLTFPKGSTKPPFQIREQWAFDRSDATPLQPPLAGCFSGRDSNRVRVTSLNKRALHQLVQGSSFFTLNTSSIDRDKPFPVVALKFDMTHHPGRMRAASALSLFSMNAAKTAPFAHRELRFAEEFRDFGRRVPVFHDLMLDEHIQSRLDCR